MSTILTSAEYKNLKTYKSVKENQNHDIKQVLGSIVTQKVQKLNVIHEESFIDLYLKEATPEF